MITSTLKLRRQTIVRQTVSLVLLAVIGTAALLWTRSSVDVTAFNVSNFAGMALAFLVACSLPLQLPQGDRVRITLMVGLAGIALLGITETLAASIAAGGVDLLLRFGKMGGAELLERAVDAIRAVLVVALLSPWQMLLRSNDAVSIASDSGLAVVMVIGATYALLDVLTIAVQERQAGGANVADGMVLLMRPLGSVYMVHIAMAAVVVRIYPLLGFWGFAIALLLTLILQNSFSLYLRIRRAYAQTIGALAHAAEMDRPDDAGHAQRVADLAVAVGRQMGLSSLDLERIGYAALLHDIGRIGGERLEADDEHPRRGAAIVAEVPFLEGVAPLIRHHRVSDVDDVALGAAVIGVCCRFDRLSLSHGAHDALELLELDEGGQRGRAVAALRRTRRDARRTVGAGMQP
ncbi:MAG: HD-GYP domain-containing protein [Coriobacteriia bacterium]